MKHIRTTLIAVLALVLAVGLGTATSASAGGLTTKAVKKIAAKVVNQKADKLSVKYAATAGDATTLGGLTKGQLLSKAYVFTIPTQDPSATARAYKFLDLPDGPYVGYGNYLVTYSIGATMSVPGATISCSVDPNLADPVAAVSIGGVNGSSSVATASGVMTIVRANAVLTCSPSAGTFTVTGGGQSTISFVPINSLTKFTAGLP